MAHHDCMDKDLFVACCLAAAALVGCTAYGPPTTAMGAPSCDLGIDVSGDRHCAVTHVPSAEPGDAFMGIVDPLAQPQPHLQTGPSH